MSTVRENLRVVETGVPNQALQLTAGALVFD
jgi:hypothetical protein